MDDCDGRAAPENHPKDAWISLRMSPRDLAIAQREADRFGLSRNDYLMALLECRPMVVALDPRDAGYLPTVRELVGAREGALLFGEREPAEIFALANAAALAATGCLDRFDALVSRIGGVQLAVSIDAAGWLGAARSRTRGAYRKAAECKRFAGDLLRAFSTRHGLGPGDAARSGRKARAVRVHPREREALAELSAAAGMNRCDYLMMVLACRPDLSDLIPHPGAPAGVLRRLGGPVREGPVVLEGAAGALRIFLPRLREALEALSGELDGLLADAARAASEGRLEATCRLSRADVAIKRAAALADGCALVAEAIRPALATGRGARRFPRVHFTDKRGELFPRG